ncbi:MAG: hypothetical protein ACXAAO_01265, partial [Candidatus Thorarchaeota archaeon]
MGVHVRRGPASMTGQKQKRSRPIRVLLGRMVHYLGKFKRIVAIGAVLSLVATIFAVFDPLVFAWAIDSVLVASPVMDTVFFLTGLYVLF